LWAVIHAARMSSSAERENAPPPLSDEGSCVTTARRVVGTERPEEVSSWIWSMWASSSEDTSEMSHDMSRHVGKRPQGPPATAVHGVVREDGQEGSRKGSRNTACYMEAEDRGEDRRRRGTRAVIKEEEVADSVVTTHLTIPFQVKCHKQGRGRFRAGRREGRRALLPVREQDRHTRDTHHRQQSRSSWWRRAVSGDESRAGARVDLPRKREPCLEGTSENTAGAQRGCPSTRWEPE